MSWPFGGAFFGAAGLAPALEVVAVAGLCIGGAGLLALFGTLFN
jgi:hypothetical protein